MKFLDNLLILGGLLWFKHKCDKIKEQEMGNGYIDNVEDTDDEVEESEEIPTRSYPIHSWERKSPGEVVMKIAENRDWDKDQMNGDWIREPFVPFNKKEM